MFNFFNSYEICCVYVPYNENFDFKLTWDAKIQPAMQEDRMPTPQQNQCLLSHFLTTLGAQEKTIDSCKNKVSADQYHLTVSRAQVSTHQGRVLFWSYPLTSY